MAARGQISVRKLRSPERTFSFLFRLAFFRVGFGSPLVVAEAKPIGHLDRRSRPGELLSLESDNLASLLSNLTTLSIPDLER